MEFVKEFAAFLHEKGIIRFGDFVLASGKKSPYYVDLRLAPSYPHEFRRMAKRLEEQVGRETGFGRFDAIVSVPTGGMIVATALAVETLKPLIYVRSKPKRHGTSRSVEGVVSEGMRAVMIDDVATTGGSVLNAIGLLRKEGITVDDAYVVIDRLEGAKEALKEEGVRMHSVANILEISEALYAQGLIDEQVLGRVRGQVGA